MILRPAGNKPDRNYMQANTLNIQNGMSKRSVRMTILILYIVTAGEGSFMAGEIDLFEFQNRYLEIIAVLFECPI